LAILLPDDMQNYVIVFRVLMMAVAMPVAGPGMDLDVSAYYAAVDGKNGIPEITAAGVTDSAWENYVKPFTGISDRVPYQVALPQTRDNPFRYLCFHVLITRLRVH
jgi:hypothetical protein